MSNEDYKAKKVMIEDINFEVVILEIPDDEINDKLTLLTFLSGNITQSDYKDFIVMNFIVNTSQLAYHLNKSDALISDYELVRTKISEAVYGCNPSLHPENIVLNKNHVARVKGTADGTPLTKNKYWNIKKEPLTSKPSDSNGSNDTSNRIKCNNRGEKVDVFDLPYDIKHVWWHRINNYIKVKQFSDKNAETILEDKYFHDRSSFNNFIVTLALVDREELFSLLDNLSIPSRVAPQILFSELSELCVQTNPKLSYNNVKRTDEEEVEEDSHNCDKKKASSTMSGYAKKEKAAQKKKFRDVEKEVLLNLASNMKMSVIGQDRAVDDVVSAILRSSIGLKDPDRPIGSFIFAGRTGCGKSLSAKVLANELIKDKNNLVTIDCSEFSADHEYAKLIGAAPGYIGYDQGGVLTNAISNNPFSVVLFDEVEKASTKVHELLLQILDEGRLTDGKGNIVKFNDTIIIMTSNVGVSEIDAVKSTVGFGDVAVLTESKKTSAIDKALKKKFKPEFLNRVDSIVHFRELDKSDYMKIIDIELHRLNENLSNNDTKYKNMRIVFDNKIKKFVYDEGVDKNYGARPIRRCIEKNISTPLAKMILSEDVDPTAVVNVSVLRNKPRFDIADQNDDQACMETAG